MKIPITIIQSQMLETAAEYNRHLQMLRLKRFVAFLATALFCSVVGISLGNLVASGASAVLVVALTCFGGWGIRHILTRHR